MNMKLAYMPSCIRPEVRLPFNQIVFCVVIVVKKYFMHAQVVFSHFVLHRSQDTFGAYDQSSTFAQPAVQTARWN